MYATRQHMMKKYTNRQHTDKTFHNLF